MTSNASLNQTNICPPDGFTLARLSSNALSLENIKYFSANVAPFDQLNDHFLAHLNGSELNCLDLPKITSFVISCLPKIQNADTEDALYSFNNYTVKGTQAYITFLNRQLHPGMSLFTFLKKWISTINNQFAVSVQKEENQKILLPLLTDACLKQPYLIGYLMLLTQPCENSLSSTAITQVLISLETLSPQQKQLSLERKHKLAKKSVTLFQIAQLCSLNREHHHACYEIIGFIVASLTLIHEFHTSWLISKPMALRFCQHVALTFYKQLSVSKLISQLTTCLKNFADVCHELPLIQGPAPSHLGVTINALITEYNINCRSSDMFLIPTVSDLLADPTEERTSITALKMNFETFVSHVTKLMKLTNCSAPLAINFLKAAIDHQSCSKDSETPPFQNLSHLLNQRIDTLTFAQKQCPFPELNNPNNLNCLVDFIWRCNDHSYCMTPENFASYLQYTKSIYDYTHCSLKKAFTLTTNFIAHLATERRRPFIIKTLNFFKLLKSLGRHVWRELFSLSKDSDELADIVTSFILPLLVSQAANTPISTDILTNFKYQINELVNCGKYTSNGIFHILTHILRFQIETQTGAISEANSLLIKQFANLNVNLPGVELKRNSDRLNTDFIDLTRSDKLECNPVEAIINFESKECLKPLIERLTFLISYSNMIMNNLACSRKTAISLIKYVLEKTRSPLSYQELQDVITSLTLDITSVNELNKELLPIFLATKRNTDYFLKIINIEQSETSNHFNLDFSGSRISMTPSRNCKLLKTSSSYLSVLNEYNIKHASYVFYILMECYFSSCGICDSIFEWAEKVLLEIILKHPFFYTVKKRNNSPETLSALNTTLTWSIALLKEWLTSNNSNDFDENYSKAVENFISFAWHVKATFNFSSLRAVEQTIDLIQCLELNDFEPIDISLTLNKLLSELEYYPLAAYLLPFIYTKGRHTTIFLQDQIKAVRHIHCFLKHFEKYENLDELLALPTASETLFHHIQNDLPSFEKLSEQKVENIIRSFRLRNLELMSKLDYIILVKSELNKIDGQFIESALENPDDKTFINYLLEEDVYNLLKASIDTEVSESQPKASSKLKSQLTLLCAMLKADPKRQSIAKYPEMFQHVASFFLSNKQPRMYAALYQACLALVTGWENLFHPLENTESLFPHRFNLNNRLSLRGTCILQMLKKQQPTWTTTDFIAWELA